jgi:hypothetical protein
MYRCGYKRCKKLSTYCAFTKLTPPVAATPLAGTTGGLRPRALKGVRIRYSRKGPRTGSQKDFNGKWRGVAVPSMCRGG